jgi:hypothetical protein
MGQKYSFDRGTFNEISFWLIFDAWGAVRITRGEPDVSANERGMHMTAKLPHALFNRPLLRGTLEVQAPSTEPIDLDVSAAATALKEALGVEIDLKVVPIDEC